MSDKWGDLAAGVFLLVLGWGIGELTNYLRSRREARDRRRAVRQLILLEVEQNCHTLREFLNVANKPASDDRPADPHVIAFNLTETPVVVWDHSGWQSQMTFIPEAFSDTEVANLYWFHNRLDVVAAHQLHLRQLQEASREDRRLGGSAGMRWLRTAAGPVALDAGDVAERCVVEANAALAVGTHLCGLRELRAVGA